jgi:hypothetical protein
MFEGTVQEVQTALHEEIDHAHNQGKDLIDHAETVANRLIEKILGPGIEGFGGLLRALQDTGAELEVPGLSQPIKLVIGKKK